MKHVYITHAIPCEKLKLVSSASSRTRSIVVFWVQSRFQVKLIGYLSFGLASSTCCLFKAMTVDI